MSTAYKFENGVEKKDCVTGFSGTIVGRSDYLTGCNQYLLQPKVKTGVDGEYQGGKWFDENRIVEPDDTTTTADDVAKKAAEGKPKDRGGPNPDAPSVQ